jgi:uncharacterized protein YpmS
MYQRALIFLLTALLVIGVFVIACFFNKVSELKKINAGMETELRDISTENKELNRLLDNYTVTIE